MSYIYNTNEDNSGPPFGITMGDIAIFDHKQEQNRVHNAPVRDAEQDVWDFMLDPALNVNRVFTPEVVGAISEGTN